MGIPWTLPGCCAPSGRCGFISTTTDMSCITSSSRLPYILRLRVAWRTSSGFEPEHPVAEAREHAVTPGISCDPPSVIAAIDLDRQACRWCHEVHDVAI